LANSTRINGPSQSKSFTHSSRPAVKRTIPKPIVPDRQPPAKSGAPANGNSKVNGKPEPKVLFQKFFKSIGPRTYATQIKELSNGNHLLVITEGKRDEETGEVRKTRVFVYGEDFTAFFRLLHETAAFIRANPLSEEVRRKRDRFWAKKAKANGRHSDE
jgi:hypothetical protein